MIPSRLVLYREKKATTDLEFELIESYGLAEAPPALGRPFIMMDNSGKEIKTGYIATIEWFGERHTVPKEHRVDFYECIFYTDNSTYRWQRLSEEGDNAPMDK